MPQPAASISSLIQLDFAQASDPGRDPNKQINEDSCGYKETRMGHVIVLCDGMGGHYGGQEASRLAITTIFEVVEAPSSASMGPRAALKLAIEEAGRRVYQLGGSPDNRVRPGSTVVAMVLHEGGLEVAHVGDSRAFVIRANQIYPLTRDHSMVQAMIDAGMLTEAEAIGHPDSNKITRALGMKPEVEVEVRPDSMELFPGDVLILCSDGLTDLALAPDILGATRQALASGGSMNACTELVRLANERGGHDNITVQIARVLSNGAPALTRSPASLAAAASAAAPPETMVMTAPAGPVTPAAAPMNAAFAPGTMRPAPTVAGVTHGPDSSQLPTIPGWSPHDGHAVQPAQPQRAVKETVVNTSPSRTPPMSAGHGQAPQYDQHGGYSPLSTPQRALTEVEGPPSSVVGSRRSSAYLVYLILGLFALVAVLAIALIWALYLR